MKAKKRLALNSDKTKVVPYESPEATYLFAAPGQEIPKALAEKYGLVDGDLPTEKPAEPEAKEKEKPEDKSRAKPETKPIIKPETKRR